RQLDSWAERAVGLTLVLLGLYVLGTLLRNKAAYVPKSRAAILMNAGRWVTWRLRCLLDSEEARRDFEPVHSYGRHSVCDVGIIHALGAEAPSQLLLFLLASNLGGPARGFLGLGVFLAGLLVMNTLMTASAVGIFGASAAKPQVMKFVVA